MTPPATMAAIGPAAGKVLVTADGPRLPTRRALVVSSAVPASRFLPPPLPPAFPGRPGLSPGPPGEQPPVLGAACSDLRAAGPVQAPGSPAPALV